MYPPDVTAFDQLPTSDQLRFVLELWERIASRPEDVPVTAAQLRELEHRLDDDDAHPNADIPLDVARQRLRGA